MKYCQGPKCHEYRTKDRIRGHKGDKHYETRKIKHTYYFEFCSQRCYYDWFNKFGKLAIDHFGRTHEPKRQDASGAWYKDTKYNGWNNGDTSYSYYFVNDLLGQRIAITDTQYNDKNIKQPTDRYSTN